MKNSSYNNIERILSSKILHIKALTSAGIISGIVTDILIKHPTKEKSLLEELLDSLSNNSSLTINNNFYIYVIKDTKFYPISNMKECIFLDRIELDSSKIIALCPLFEEVD